MTVAELIAHLQTLPQEAEVSCLQEESSGWDTYTQWKNLTLDDISLTDLRGNQFVKPSDTHIFNKVFLEIGCK